MKINLKSTIEKSLITFLGVAALGSTLVLGSGTKADSITPAEPYHFAQNVRTHRIRHGYTKEQKLLIKKSMAHGNYLHSRKYLRRHPRIALRYKYNDILLAAGTMDRQSERKLNSLHRAVKRTRGFSRAQRRYLFKEIHEANNSQIIKTFHNLTNIKTQIKHHHQKHLTKSQKRIMKQANYLIRKYKNDDIIKSLAAAENDDQDTLFNVNHRGVVETD